MLQTVEAIIEKGNHIQFAEPLEFPITRQRVLVILLNDEYNSFTTENNKPVVNSKVEFDVPRAIARLRKLSQGIRWKTDDGMSLRDAREEGPSWGCVTRLFTSSFLSFPIS